MTLALSCLATIAALWFAVWLLMTGWQRILDVIEASESRRLRLVQSPRAVVPDLYGCCGERGYHAESCSRLDQWDRGVR